MIPYSFDLDEVRKKARELNLRKILLHLPAGMHVYATEIADSLEDEFEVFISSRSSYGACDIEIHPDMLTVQFGHSEIPNIKYPEYVLFLESFSEVSFLPALENLKLGCSRVGIVASVQHIGAVEEVAEFLKSRGVEARVGRGDGRIKYPGQVLGCNFSTARAVKKEVDCFLFLGSGVFHPLGVAVSTKKPVYAVDPYSKKIERITHEDFMRRRYAAIASIMEAKRFGIIVSSKIGQRRTSLAMEVLRVLREEGRKGYPIMTDDIVPESFYYDVDAYVNTACPRVTYDDYARFQRPVVTPGELLIALGRKKWDSLSFDEIVEVD